MKQMPIEAILEAFIRARAGEAVQVGCRGGVGRTGTVLSCIATLSGVPVTEAVAWVRTNYRPQAVDNEAQEAWVLGFAHRHGPRCEGKLTLAGQCAPGGLLAGQRGAEVLYSVISKRAWRTEADTAAGSFIEQQKTSARKQ